MNSNLLTRFGLIYLISLGIVISAFSQVSIEWSQYTTEPNKTADGRFIEIGPDGNIVQVGHTDAGGANLDYYAAKYDTTGNLIWHTTFDNTTDPYGTSDIPNGMALDADGNVYISGVTETSTYQDRDWPVVRIDADGQFNWSYVFPAQPNAIAAGYGLKVGSNNTLYVAGRTAERLTLARFDLDGNMLGTTIAPGTYLGIGIGLDLDALNNVYMVGIYEQSQGLAKFDASGAYQWAESLQPEYSSFNVLSKIRLSNDESSLYLGGTSWGNYLPDGTQVDITTGNFDTDGGQNWYYSWDTLQLNQTFIDFEADDAGNIYTLSYYGLGSDQHSLIDKYDASGMFKWRTIIDTTNNWEFNALYIAPMNYLVCVGNGGRICILDMSGHIISDQLNGEYINYNSVAMEPGDNNSLYIGGTGIPVDSISNEMRVDKLNGFPWSSPVSNAITLDLKVFLEGPYNGTDMNTTLDADGDLPLEQPYNTAPWNYAGTESVAAIPNSDVVEWVIIELRDAASADQATPATRAAQQAAFLLKDGSVRGLDGTSLLQFNVNISNNLYVAVWQRNHLGILSADALVPSSGVYTWDFTTGADKVYGGLAGYKQVGSSVYGMASGDGNADGSIDSIDKADWEPAAGTKGYSTYDYNLDGETDNPDKDDMWITNSGLTNQIPQ